MNQWLKSFLGAACCVAFLLAFAAPSAPAHAFESEKIVLMVFAGPGKIGNDESAALLGKLKTQFKFPKYEILQNLPEPRTLPDDSVLAKIVADAGAGGVVILQVNRFQSLIRPCPLSDELCEDTSVDLTLHYYNKKTGQAGHFDGYSNLSQLREVDADALPVALAILDGLLDKLDKIFPRQFPGPRY